MRPGVSKILVTGGAGFIGSAFVRALLLNRDSFLRATSLENRRKQSLDYKVVIIDKLTYAGDLTRLNEVKDKYKFYKADICDKKRIELIFKRERPDIIVHFAAESHVDRSIQDSTAFIQTNVIGTQVLLDLSRKYKIGRFIQTSTDEVYGEIKKGSFTEDSPLKPNSPYAASKAAADLLVRTYIRTYNFPAIIVRPCNNYGPWQYPEKLIPVVISKALKNEKVPVYAKGLNIREWLYVDDCATAILKIVEKGRIGEVYNIGSGNEKNNISTVKEILNCLSKPHRLIKFVRDRPGHDIRYSLNSRKITRELGWKPRIKLAEGFKLTVDWSLGHKFWLKSKLVDINKLYKKAR